MDAGDQAHDASPHNEPPSAPEPPQGRWRALAAAFWHQTLHGLPAVLWLALLTLVIESPPIRELPLLQVFEDVEGYFMRQVVRTVIQRQYAQAETLPAPPASAFASAPAPAPASDRIKLIEVSTAMRIKEFEALPENLAESEFDRVGGVRPVNRAAMATLIEKLAERLGKLPLQARPRVVAIDVDLAPLYLVPPDTTQKSQDVISEALKESTDRLRKALNTLRRQAHVIVIALDRPDRPDPELRRLRNTFMRDMACTRSGLSNAAAKAHDPAAVTPEAASHGLYFASPRLFQGIYDYPLRYPFEPEAHAEKDSTDAHAGDFPSLGNLIRLRVDAPDAQTPAALTQICDEADEPPKGDANGCILEDRIAATSGADCPAFKLAAYKQRLINWRLLESGLIDRTQLKSLKSLESLVSCSDGKTCLANLDDDALTAGVLLIGIEAARATTNWMAPPSPPTRSAAACCMPWRRSRR